MPGEIRTLGKEIKPIPGKLLNEIIELEEGPNAYTIKTGNGRTLFIYNQFCIGKKPEVGDLVCDYCEICGSYKFSDFLTKRCRYKSQYGCEPNFMTCFENKPVEEKKPNFFEIFLNKLKLNKTK